MNYALLAKSPLFKGCSNDEIESILKCLNANLKKYQKGDLIYEMNQKITSFGLVLDGRVSIEYDDIWGNRTILDTVGVQRVFAETYACVPDEPLMVNVFAIADSQILFLDINNILNICGCACNHHLKLIRNLLTISAQKNINLSRRSLITASKSLRSRILSYLSYQVMLQGKNDLYIPFDRQQLADYLNVDRSALSNELSKLRNEGLLQFDKNHFIILTNINM